MSTRSPDPAPWQSTEALPPHTETTRPLPPLGTPYPPGGATSATATQPRTDSAAVTAADSWAGSDGPPPPSAGHASEAPAAPSRSAFSPVTFVLGTFDLVLDCFVNFAIFVLLATLVGLGVVTIPAAGVGVLVLVGVVYVAWGAVWLERMRSASSFGLDLRAPYRRRSPRTDWVRVPHQVWLDASDGSVWLGVVHLAVTLCLGVLAVTSLVTAGIGIAWAFAPLYLTEHSFAWEAVRAATVSWNQTGAGDPWPTWLVILTGVAASLVSLGVLSLCVLAHRGLSRGLLGMSEEDRLRRAAEDHERHTAYVAAQRDSAVRGAHTERSRIERDLHDGVQPQLVSVAMNLSMARGKVDTDPAAAKELISEAHGTTKAAITELRRLARGFHPAVLEDRGLDAAITAVAAQAPFPVDVTVRAPRLSPQTEAAVYFAVSESLTNAVKHSGARSADVAVTLQDGPEPGSRVVVAGVRDTGRGGARVLPGGGLSGIEDRVRSAGGQFYLISPAGGPTEVIVELPAPEAQAPAGPAPESTREGEH